MDSAVQAEWNLRGMGQGKALGRAGKSRVG